MAAHEPPAALTHEAHKHALSYPRVVSHTHTTAFMVVPVTSAVPFAPSQPLLTTHQAAVPLPAKRTSHLSALQSSSSTLASTSLSYLADPCSDRNLSSAPLSFLQPKQQQQCQQQPSVVLRGVQQPTANYGRHPLPTSSAKENIAPLQQEASNRVVEVRQRQGEEHCLRRHHSHRHLPMSTEQFYTAAAPRAATSRREKFESDSYSDCHRVADIRTPISEKLNPVKMSESGEAAEKRAISELTKSYPTVADIQHLHQQQTNFNTSKQRRHGTGKKETHVAEVEAWQHRRALQCDQPCVVSAYVQQSNVEVRAKQETTEPFSFVAPAAESEQALRRHERNTVAVEAREDPKQNVAINKSHFLRGTTEKVNTLPSAQKAANLSRSDDQPILDGTKTFTELPPAHTSSASTYPNELRTQTARTAAPHRHTGETSTLHAKNAAQAEAPSPPPQSDRDGVEQNVVGFTALPSSNRVRNRTHYSDILAPVQSLQSTPSAARYEAEVSAATAVTANESSHELFTAHYPAADVSVLNATAVSALSPLSASPPLSSPSSARKAAVQRRVDAVQLTPEDFLTAPSPISSPSPSPMRGAESELLHSDHQLQQQRQQQGRRRSWLRRASQSPEASQVGVAQASVSPTSPSRSVSSPSPSLSPPLRGRLSFDTAAGTDERRKNLSEDGRSVSNILLGEQRGHVQHPPPPQQQQDPQESQEHISSSVSLMSPFLHENARRDLHSRRQDDGTALNLSSPLSADEMHRRRRLQQQQGENNAEAQNEEARHVLQQRCHLLCTAEAAAREWIAVDASVRLHHLACEERVCYRSAEAAQYRRRLCPPRPSAPQSPQVDENAHAAPCMSPGNAQNCKDFLTPPEQREGHGVQGNAAAEVAALLAAAPLEVSPDSPTSPLTSLKVHRRMPSVSSLPPLSPQRPQPPLPEESDEDYFNAYDDAGDCADNDADVEGSERENRRGAEGEEENSGRDVVSPPYHDACSLSPSQEPQHDNRNDLGGDGDFSEGDADQLNQVGADRTADARAASVVDETRVSDTQSAIEMGGEKSGLAGHSSYAEGEEEAPARARSYPGEAGTSQEQLFVRYESDGSAEWEDEPERSEDVEETERDANASANMGEDAVVPCSIIESNAAGSEVSGTTEIEQSGGGACPAHEVPHSKTFTKAASRGTRRSPPLRVAAPPTPPVSAALRQQLQGVVDDEEDSRYLLTGECPPPRVFQRWADRFLHEQQSARPELSPEAVEPEVERTSAVEVGVHNAAAISPDPSAGSSFGNEIREPISFAATMSTSRDDGRSASRQRLCSERNRAWVMESFLEDVHAGSDGGALYRVSGSGVLRDRSEARSYSENGVATDSPVAVAAATAAAAFEVYNASGRHAPDPRIFDDDNCAQRAASASPASAVPSSSSSVKAVSASAERQRTSPEMKSPSALNITALPDDTSASLTLYMDNAPSAVLVPASSAAEGSRYASLTYPSEETYDAPFGSERDAWQVLMDGFIEGLVKLMSNEA